MYSSKICKPVFIQKDNCYSQTNTGKSENNETHLVTFEKVKPWLRPILRCVIGCVLLPCCLGQGCLDLQINDDVGQSDTTDVHPTANAGNDIEVTEGDLVKLDGSGSFGNGDLKYLWVQVSGPPVVLGADNQPIVTFEAPQISSTDKDYEQLTFKLVIEQIDSSIDPSVKAPKKTDEDKTNIKVNKGKKDNPPGQNGGGGKPPENSCPDPVADSDGDGVPDCEDNCPNDPNKTDAGACGCGVADTDSDSDGTPDCNDNCLNDPNKTNPGVCGCGTAETDSDSDGTPDCNDNCPNDPNKTNPGVCGCGIADTDSDSDGVPDCNDEFPNDPNNGGAGVCRDNICGINETADTCPWDC
ncbi:MAG: thrombospondin type 3 repeat-containing protein, partial [Planctomycetota bacterium]